MKVKERRRGGGRGGEGGEEERGEGEEGGRGGEEERGERYRSELWVSIS